MSAGKGPLQISCVDIAVAVVEHEGKFLIGLRTVGVALAGLWEFPGGKVESGETPAAAAVRECLEETGLSVHVTGQYPQVVHDYPHGRVRLHFLACAPAEPPRGLPQGFRWVLRTDLKQYSFPPANSAVIELLWAGKRT